MKVCTYNVNSIRARIDLVLDWLKKRGNDLDVLCLQELKVIAEDFPTAEISSLGYQTEIFSQRQYNGVAICSKKKIERVNRGLGDPYWDRQKRVIACKIDGVDFVNVYAPHGEVPGGEKYKYKLSWYQFFISYLQKNFSPHEPLVVVGDLNITESDMDVYDAQELEGAIGTMAEEREALKSLYEWGLIDTYRYLKPEEQEYTWWSYMGGSIWKNEGMRIDYVLCTKPLLQRLKDVEIDMWPRRRRKPTPSDHAPVIVDF